MILAAKQLARWGAALMFRPGSADEATPAASQEQVRDLLICVYTCEAHRAFLDEFYQSDVGRYLVQLPNSAMFEVYADPLVERSHHSGNRLFLKTPERYDALNLKTFEMICYCVRTFRFRRLLKIDVTTVQTRFEGPEYKDRIPLDLEKLLQSLKDSPPERDYDGFRLHTRVSKRNVQKWAAKKGIEIDFERIYGEERAKPFFSGKCYFVSRAFAEFMAQNGADVVREHAAYLPGAEDAMVGRLFHMFAGDVLSPAVVPPPA